MSRPPVDLSAHINDTVHQGHPADFPITLKPILIEGTAGEVSEVPKRFAVVRTDTGQALSVVSDRYSLVTHQDLLAAVERATGGLDVGPVPRGIYVDRGGARMRALFKFPELEQPICGTDRICPCIKLENTYDGTSRITVHIGAFRFVCTNLAVGGGGVFAGGFMSIHSGQIQLDDVAAQLSDYLTRFELIVARYRSWEQVPLDRERFTAAMEALPIRARSRIITAADGAAMVFAAYNAATYHATHSMRSACSAFDLLALINRQFQHFFSVN